MSPQTNINNRSITNSFPARHELRQVPNNLSHQRGGLVMQPDTIWNKQPSHHCDERDGGGEGRGEQHWHKGGVGGGVQYSDGGGIGGGEQQGKNPMARGRRIAALGWRMANGRWTARGRSAEAARVRRGRQLREWAAFLDDRQPNADERAGG